MDDFALAMRLRFSAAMALPRRVVRPLCDHHDRMAHHWLEHAINLGRPPYREARGFTRDRWQLNPRPGMGYDTWRPSICGAEKPHGYGSRAFWRTVWLAIRSVFLAEWYRATGAMYETTEGGQSSFVVLTGLTS